MTNYYIEKDSNIIIVETDKNIILTRLKHQPQYQGLEILETERSLVLSEDGTYYVFADTDEYLQEQLIKARQTKYAEITEKYDYANKYLILKVDDEQELYANVAWYQTWSKVMSLAQQLAPQSETTTIPSPVRFYKLTPDGKLYNKNVSDLDVTKLLEYFNKVQFAQFNILQPKRDILYLQLAQAKTIEDIEAIEVDFGITLNEQDMADVTAKVDLTYVEPTEEQPVEEETDLVEVEDEEVPGND